MYLNFEKGYCLKREKWNEFSIETVELFSIQNIRLLIDKFSFTTVNFITSENKPSITLTYMYLGTSECML